MSNPTTTPSLNYLRLSVQNMVGQLVQAATQLRRARFDDTRSLLNEWDRVHGLGTTPSLVASITDGCALSEVAGLLGGAEASVRAALSALEAHMREVDRRAAADGRA